MCKTAFNRCQQTHGALLCHTWRIVSNVVPNIAVWGGGVWACRSVGRSKVWERHFYISPISACTEGFSRCWDRGGYGGCADPFMEAFAHFCCYLQYLVTPTLQFTRRNGRSRAQTLLFTMKMKHFPSRAPSGLPLAPRMALVEGGEGSKGPRIDFGQKLTKKCKFSE